MNDTARTEEHAAARHKRITGSRIGKIMAGSPAAWDTLSDMLHDPEPEKFYSLENTPNMPEPLRRGLEYEPQARADFFFRHDEYDIEQPMFCQPGEEKSYNKETGIMIHKGIEADKDLWEWVGVSPDGILKSGVMNVLAGLELKVPSLEKHLEWAQAGIVPAEHLPQCFLSLLVTGADHWWFCSFCPEIEGDERFFEVKLEREDLYLQHMKNRIRIFLEGHQAHKTFAKPAPVQEAIPATSFPVVKFGIEDKAIDVLIERYGTMVAPTTSPEYAVVKAANIDLVKRRTGIKKVYDKATEEAKDYIAGVRTEKNRLTGRLADVEAHTKQLRTAWEDEQLRIKEEKEAKEAERIATIRDAIEFMNTDAMRELDGLTSAKITEHIKMFSRSEITESRYEEFFTEAQNARMALLVKAEDYRLKVIDQEQEAARVAQEQKELRERNELLERENKERLDREEKEEIERVRAKNIDDQFSWIRESVMEALDGTLAGAEAIVTRLKKVPVSFFEERSDEVIALLEKTIKVVDGIIADKKAELDALEPVGDGVTDDTEAIRAGAPISTMAADSKIDFDEGEKPFPTTALFEQLSAIQHDLIWCHWQRYVHAKLSKTRAIPMADWRRWEQQINTPYNELSESEKDSDREQVAKFWDLIKEQQS